MSVESTKEPRLHQIEALSPQMDAVIKVYGKVERIEAVDKKSYGDSFVRSA